MQKKPILRNRKMSKMMIVHCHRHFLHLCPKHTFHSNLYLLTNYLQIPLHIVLVVIHSHNHISTIQVRHFKIQISIAFLFKLFLTFYSPFSTINQWPGLLIKSKIVPYISSRRAFCAALQFRGKYVVFQYFLFQLKVCKSLPFKKCKNNYQNCHIGYSAQKPLPRVSSLMLFYSSILCKFKVLYVRS